MHPTNYRTALVGSRRHRRKIDKIDLFAKVYWLNNDIINNYDDNNNNINSNDDEDDDR